MTSKRIWNQGWEFVETEYQEENRERFPKEELYQCVDLPHDWLIYNTRELYRDSLGWYRKKFQYTKDGKLWIVRFEAVYMDSTVYVNGQEIGSWKYGYSTFDMNLTEYLKEGENEIIVRVVHKAPNSRWYSGAGIYRNVWLIQKPQTHLVLDGIYVTPIRRENDWCVEVDTEVQIGEVKFDAIRQIIYDMDGAQIVSVVEQIADCKEVTGIKEFHQNLTVENPKLWDIGQGNLYILETVLSYQGQEVDRERQRFGFRTICLDAEKGFFLNDRHVKIQGSCEHHGFGCLGAVANRSALRRKLEMLRSMGVNAIRTAHNMPSVALMELADEMGFLVDSEAFDMWGRAKTTYDYARFFAEWMPKDVRSWIRRDRNHPSVILWSLGNEIYDMHAGKEGLEELEALIGEVRKQDPKGHGKLTFASNYMRWENAQKCAPLVDAVGYNYGEYLYEEHHKSHPDWVIYGSETASMLGSRNVYHFPLAKDILCEDDEQCSALGNCFAGWGAHSYLDNILWDRDANYSLGQFIWTGFDYFGEPTPYQTKNSYFGQIDTAGFPKDSFYIYQAEWTDYKEAPMVHVFPYWDFCEGQMVDVCICSNAPKVELFVNGVSQGSRDLDHISGKNLVPSWNIPYHKGEICAVAYDRAGKVIAMEKRHSFGNAVGLSIKPDREAIFGDPDELVFVEISAYDAEGYPVENANNRVQIEVSGAGRLVGIDNGDSTDFDQVKGKSKRLFQGKLLAVIAPRGGMSGTITIDVSSPGIVGNQCILQVDESIGESAIGRNKSYEIVAGGIGAGKAVYDEVPIRKLELICEKEPVFYPSQKELRVACKIEPENATYQDIRWKVVNDIGIEVSTASLYPEANSVLVKANGDGEFRLRCIAMNGGTVAHVRSDICMKAEALGSATMNPYEEIKGGLAANRPEGLSEGVDHGVRFMGKRKTCIRFEHLDFGKYGTEEMYLELFKYSVEPVHFDVYLEGEERKLLCHGVFDQSAEWLEFKVHTCMMTEKLTGVRTISIETEHDFQLKTFWFGPIIHGLEKIPAASCNAIFGDHYEKKGDCVEKIGNNVTLHFDDLDFGNQNVSKLVICGRSKLLQNSIHVKIEKNGESDLELIEFSGSEEYVEREFEIKPLNGVCNMRLIFLPGSEFDLAWIQLK